jgi:hypothetical protein
MKITCKEASRLISEGLDSQLSLSDKAALRLHLAVCGACNRLKAQFEFLRRALSSYAERNTKDDDAR